MRELLWFMASWRHGVIDTFSLPAFVDMP